MVNVLAGRDGDPDRAREITNGIVHPGPPTLGAVAWLWAVLDDQRRRAGLVAPDVEAYSWRGEALGWVPESRRQIARIDAERAVLAMHDGAHGCPDVAQGCSVARWLAWGHRLDAEGWLPEWAPLDADLDQ